MLLFMDGPHWLLPDILYRYYGQDDAALQAFSRRSGLTNSIKLSEWLGNLSSSVTIDLPQRTGIVSGVAFYSGSSPTSNTNPIMYFARDDSFKAGVRFGANNTWSVTINGVTYTSDIDKYSASTWMYIELKFYLHPTDGYFELRVNQETLLNVSNIATTSIDNDYVNFGVLENPGINLGASYFQDYYICDLLGSYNNDFKGDIKVECIRPVANYQTDFNSSNSDENWENVDGSQVSASVYNQSSIIGDVDIYEIGDITDTVIHGIQQFTVMQKTDAGEKSARQKLISGTSSTDGDVKILNLSPTGYRRLFDVDPNTSLPWTNSGINGIKTGVEVIS